MILLNMKWNRVILPID